MLRQGTHYTATKIDTFITAFLLVCAAPLEDVSVTSIDLVEERLDAKGDEHLYVTVTRTDDLIDDDGVLLAERVMAVQVTFDVAENQQVRVIVSCIYSLSHTHSHACNISFDAMVSLLRLVYPTSK